MTTRRRILIAAVLTLGTGVGYWLYQAWPEWFGRDVALEVSVGLRQAGSSRVSLEFPASRLKLDVPGALPDDSPVPAYVVRQIGEVWPAGSDVAQSARRLHGRVVYVQVENGKPVSVSVARVEGAVNLHVRVTHVEPTGRFHVALGPPLFHVPADFSDTALVTAVFRVLPSGRHSMTSLK